MKKFYLTTALAFAALAMLSVSCINKDYDANDAKATVTIEVDKTSELAPQSLFGLEDNAGITANENGELSFGASSGSVTIPVEPGKEVTLDQTLEVDMTTAPDIVKKSSGGTLANPGVKVELTNPTSEPLIFRGKISVDHSQPISLPEVEIPANKSVELLYTPDVNSPAESADLFAALPDVLTTKLSEGVEESLTLTDVALLPKNAPKGSVKLAGASDQLTIALKYVAPLAFTKGSVIKLPLKFTELGFDIDKYVEGSVEFDVNFSGVNYLPFDVNFTAVSEDANLTGKLNKTIAGAMTSEGAPFDAVFSVKKLASKAIINNVTLNLEVKAVKTPAVLNSKVPFVITADTVKIIK